MGRDYSFDRLMKLTVIVTDHTKDALWVILHTKICNMPADNYIVFADHLNGNISNRTDSNQHHGSKGCGRRNESGKYIINFADTCNLLNT